MSPAERTYTDRLLALAEDGLWPHHSRGDGLSPGHRVAPEGPMPTATMMLHRVAGRTADLCEVLGRSAAHDRYREAAETIAGAYHRCFFDAPSGTYRSPGAGYRQAMNVLPPAFGAVPAERADEVGAGFIADLEHRTGRSASAPPTSRAAPRRAPCAGRRPRAPRAPAPAHPRTRRAAAGGRRRHGVDDRLRKMAFDVASGERPALGAPGFRAPADRHGFDIERYARPPRSRRRRGETPAARPVRPRPQRPRRHRGDAP
ncbi:hypothetical protein I6J71_11875 [Amycolatopsis sp. FDAARGOS 1241]|nr:hypothetical protein I6J71_11875 [Amycolatopsis sp. FDAARGOS 1241]